ncbi:MAG: hypothetical protein P1P90_01945 [Patescibacteria group bacterium]|nr:hypothetical protein [Patescibacteria group bacterium]
MPASNARKLPQPKEDTENNQDTDRKASEISIPDLSQDDLRALTDTELRRCMNGAEARSRMPGLRGSSGAKDYRILKGEFNRRHPGKKPPRWRSIPPPPKNPSK